MPELNIDEFLVLVALETVYKKNRTQFTNDMLEWAPNRFEPIDRRQWLTETELMQLLGSKLPGKRFHDAVFAVSETLEAAQRQEFSGIDPSLGNTPFAIRVSVDGNIEYLDQSFKVVSKERLGNGQSWNSIDTHERLRILPRGLQLLREFRQPPEESRSTALHLQNSSSIATNLNGSQVGIPTGQVLSLPTNVSHSGQNGAPYLQNSRPRSICAQFALLALIKDPHQDVRALCKEVTKDDTQPDAAENLRKLLYRPKYLHQWKK